MRCVCEATGKSSSPRAEQGVASSTPCTARTPWSGLPLSPDPLRKRTPFCVALNKAARWPAA